MDFELRRQSDPQGVIEDLLKQSARQAKEIHIRGESIKEKDKEISKLIKKIEKLEKNESLLQQ